MFKIAFFKTKSYYKTYFEKVLLEKECMPKFFEMPLTEETVFLANGCDAVCIPLSSRVDRIIINKMYGMGIRYLFVIGIGSQNIDVQEAEDKLQIILIDAYSTESVAEYSFGMMLAASRQIHRSYIRTRDYNISRSGLMGSNVEGKTVGIIGMGRVGSRVAQMYQCFHADVIAYDIVPREMKEVEFVELEELFARSDIISIHIPTTKETNHLINRYTIEKMKKGVILVSTSGAGVIEFYDLMEALRQKNKIGAVAIDYNEEEERRPDIISFADEDLEDIITQLSAFNNVLLTSNLGYHTTETIDAIAEDLVCKIGEIQKAEKNL